MKIAYLVHTARPFEEASELLRQLTKQGDHAFVMINDNDQRDNTAIAFSDQKRIHISRTQEYAQEGDLSLARGTIIQMKEALEIDDFDYFINLTDGMMPIKTRKEIEQFLQEANGKDFYYVHQKETPELKKKAEKYYTFTNMLSFPTSSFMRAFTKGNANFLRLFGLKRTLDEPYQIGSPWFILSKSSAKELTKHFEYVSNAFKMSWYPEEMYIPMMMNKYVYKHGEDTHVNKDYRVVGPNGLWQESSGAKPITKDCILQHPEALFAGRITTEDDLNLYQEYFDIYNTGYVEIEEIVEKEFIDPEKLRQSIKDAQEKAYKK